MSNNFFNLVDNAVALNIEHQLKFEDAKRHMAPAHWLQDFGTVNISTGRATGKTMYVAARMKPCDIVLVPLEHDVEDYYRKAGQRLNNVFSARTIFDRFNMSGYWRGRRDVPEYFNKVYVDEPSGVFATRDSRYQFFDWFGTRCNQVIALGNVR